MTGWQSVCWGKEKGAKMERNIPTILGKILGLWSGHRQCDLCNRLLMRAGSTEIHGQGHISVMFHWCATLQPVLSKLTGMQDWTTLGYKLKPKFLSNGIGNQHQIFKFWVAKASVRQLQVEVQTSRGGQRCCSSAPFFWLIFWILQKCINQRHFLSLYGRDWISILHRPSLLGFGLFCVLGFAAEHL